MRKNLKVRMKLPTGLKDVVVSDYNVGVFNTLNGILEDKNIYNGIKWFHIKAGPGLGKTVMANAFVKDFKEKYPESLISYIDQTDEFEKIDIPERGFLVIDDFSRIDKIEFDLKAIIDSDVHIISFSSKSLESLDIYSDELYKRQSQIMKLRVEDPDLGEIKKLLVHFLTLHEISLEEDSETIISYLLLINGLEETNNIYEKILLYQQLKLSSKEIFERVEKIFNPRDPRFSPNSLKRRVSIA